MYTGRCWSAKWTVALVLSGFYAAAYAQNAEPVPAPTEPAADVGWPRLHKAQGYEVVMLQPQVDRWKNYEQLFYRSAVVIRNEGGSVFGSIQGSAPTSVDLDARIVFIGPRKIESLTFGDVSPAEVEHLKKIVLEAIPDERPLTISLDRVFAAVLAGEEEKAKGRRNQPRSASDLYQ